MQLRVLTLMLAAIVVTIALAPGTAAALENDAQRALVANATASNHTTTKAPYTTNATVSNSSTTTAPHTSNTTTATAGKQKSGAALAVVTSGATVIAALLASLTM